MNSVSIIKAFDVIEYRQFRILSGYEVVMVYPLILQVREEALRHCIVVRRLSTIHARPHLSLCQLLSIDGRAVYRASVSMVH